VKDTFMERRYIQSKQRLEEESRVNAAEGGEKGGSRIKDTVK
jgi:hypothetical protein